MGWTRMNYEKNVTYNKLPVLVADDDFIEHLHELGFVDTIDVNDLAFERLDWSKENVDE
jgi:hypothetical protein